MTTGGRPKMLSTTADFRGLLVGAFGQVDRQMVVSPVEDFVGEHPVGRFAMTSAAATLTRSRRQMSSYGAGSQAVSAAVPFTFRAAAR